MTASTREAEKLVSDVKTVVRDADNLLRATGNDLSEKTQEARQKLREAMESAKESLKRAEVKLAEKAKQTDELVRTHPYQSIGIAAGVGVLLGFLIGRK